MRFKVFISSVQREFAAERQMLAEYVRKDALLGKFFDVFLFEEEPACDVEVRDLYLPGVEKSDIYLGILGAQFGNADAEGVSLTEREYDLATIKGKERLVFVKKCERDPREERFVQKVQSDVVRKSFETAEELQLAVYAGGVESTAGAIVAQSNGPVVAQSWPSRVFNAISAVGEASTSDLAAALSLDNSSGSLKRALRILLSDGIIEYTIPQKPRSRLQKYRLTEKGRQMLVDGSSAMERC